MQCLQFRQVIKDKLLQEGFLYYNEDQQLSQLSYSFLQNSFFFQIPVFEDIYESLNFLAYIANQNMPNRRFIKDEKISEIMMGIQDDLDQISKFQEEKSFRQNIFFCLYQWKQIIYERKKSFYFRQKVIPIYRIHQSFPYYYKIKQFYYVRFGLRDNIFIGQIFLYKLSCCRQQSSMKMTAFEAILAIVFRNGLDLELILFGVPQIAQPISGVSRNLAPTADDEHYTQQMNG